MFHIQVVLLLANTTKVRPKRLIPFAEIGQTLFALDVRINGKNKYPHSKLEKCNEEDKHASICQINAQLKLPSSILIVIFLFSVELSL